MAQLVTEQRQWKGISRRSPTRDDESTSHSDINTEPGEDELRRIGSMQPYLSSRLAAPMFRFGTMGSHLRLRPFGNQTTAYLNANFRVNVCFKWEGGKQLLGNTANTGVPKVIVATCTRDNTPTEECAWELFIQRDTTNGVWRLSASWATTDNGSTGMNQDTFTLADCPQIVEGTTYWAYFIMSSPNATMYLYANGSMTATSVTKSTTRGAGSSSYHYMTCLGGAPHSQRTLINGSIGWFSLGNTTATTPQIWRPFGLEGINTNQLYVFQPHRGRYTCFPAIRGDSSNKHTWELVPKPGIESASASGIFNATGVVNYPGNVLAADLWDIDLFSSFTCFMFYCQGTTNDKWLVSDDGSLAIWNEGGVINVEWCSDQAAYYRASSSTAGQVTDQTDGWYAVTLDGAQTGTAALCNIYKWNTGTSAWDNVTAGSVATLPTAEISAWASFSRRFYLGFAGKRQHYLYDFRVSTSRSWSTENTNVLATNLRSWLNLSPSTALPGASNCSRIYETGGGDVYTPTIAITDRVDGVIRYRALQECMAHGWDATTYLNYGTSEAESVSVAVDGTVRILTDANLLSGDTLTPRAAQNGIAQHVLVDVGRNGYTAGAELTSVNNVRRVGPIPAIPASWWTTTVSYPFTPSQTTYGQLDNATLYKCKFVLHDEITGTDGTPLGPFYFTTSGGTTGQIGINVDVRFTSPIPLDGMQLRFYRYVEGTGDYHLEGAAAFSIWNGRVEANVLLWSAKCVFGMNDDDLAMREVLDPNYSGPPWHNVSLIANSRAWYVDAAAPSRVRFSKVGEYGDCPEENLVLTDEGSGGNILGMLEGFGGIMLLRERSIWVIPYAQDDSAIAAQPLLSGIGCVSGSSALIVDGVMYIASPSGIYIWNGETPPYQKSLDLGGIDRLAWDSAPGETRGYYDRANWRVVFQCQGTAVTIDVRTGAAAIHGSPIRCCAEIATSDFAGTIYGSTGMAWKQVDGSVSQCLDEYALGAGAVDGLLEIPVSDLRDPTALTEAYRERGWSSQNANYADTMDIDTSSSDALYINHGSSVSDWLNATHTSPYAYRWVAGNFDIVIKSRFSWGGSTSGIDAIQGLLACGESGSNDWFFVGMQRVDATSSYQYLWRATVGDATTSGTATGLTDTSYYFRISRVGQVFTLYTSANGSTWTQRYQTTSLAFEIPMKIGFVVGSTSGSTNAGGAMSEMYTLDGEPLTFPISLTTDLTAITNYYYNGLTTVTKIEGYQWSYGLCANTYNTGANYDFLTPGTLVGRTFTEVDYDNHDIWSAIVERQERGGYYYMRCPQTDHLAYQMFELIPCYHRSQFLYWNSKNDAKIISAMDFLTGETGDEDATGQVSFTCELLGASTVGEVTVPDPVTDFTFGPQSKQILPIRTRCYRGYYEFQTDTHKDFPPIVGVRTHFTPIRPRGRTR